MKSGSAERNGRGGLGGRWQLFGRIVFLMVGYMCLSPVYCRKGMEWLWAFLEKVSPAWLPDAVRGLVAPGSAVGVVLRALPAAVAAAVLAGAVVCVCGLFVEWRKEKTCFALAMGAAAVAAVLVKWGEAGGQAMEAGSWFWPALHKVGLVGRAYWPYLEALYAGVCLILLAGWLASLLYQWMKSGGGRATGLVGFVVAGCVLYEILDRQGMFENRFRAERWVRPVQVLDQVFGVLDKPKDEEMMGALHPGLAGAYYLFHAMLFFFGAFVVVGAVSKPLVNAILLRFMRTPDCVFWGVSPEALALARSLSGKRKGKRRLECVFVLERTEVAEESDLERSAFLWVVEGQEVPSVTVRRARKHFFLAVDGSVNIAHAERLAKVARGEPEVWVRIDDEADDSWLHQWADRPDIRDAMDVHVVRETSLAADILLRKHPMLEAPGVVCGEGTAKGTDGDGYRFRVLLVGFGWQGRMILNRTICDAQAPGTRFEAEVVDRDPRAMELYRVRNPDAWKAYNLSAHVLDVQSKAFYVWLDRRLANKAAITRIVVATGDDALNLEVATYIDRQLREREGKKWSDEAKWRLYVRVRHPGQFAGVGEEGKRPFTAFGSLEEIYSWKAMLDSEEDRIARIMNARWDAKDGQIPSEEDMRRSWRKASFFNRESSRASAMGVWNLWRLSGGAEKEKAWAEAKRKEKEELEKAGKKVPEEQPEPPEARQTRRMKEWESILKQQPVLAGRLADAEHLRWMAFHYVRGVRPWDWRAEPDFWREAGNKVKANLREGANRHAALVPTSELPELELWLETTCWKEREAAFRIMPPGLEPTAKEKTAWKELADWAGKYAEEVAARARRRAAEMAAREERGNAAENVGEPARVGDYDGEYPLWMHNKLAWLCDLWWNTMKSVEAKGFRFWWDTKEKAEEKVFRSQVTMALRQYVESMENAREKPPKPLPSARLPTAENLKKAQHRWLRCAVVKAAGEMKAYRDFLEKADALFTTGNGPDRRFRTPGDLVDNDMRTVMSVPEYLENPGEP